MFKLSGILNKNAFLELADQLETNKGLLCENDEVYIDISKILFADPFGIIGLIIFTRHVYNKYGLKCVIALPERPDVQQYLFRAGITKDEGEITRFIGKNINLEFRAFLSKLNYFAKEYTNVNFIPITDICNTSDIAYVNDNLDKWMRSNNYNTDERYDIMVLVSEICQNIIYHSETKQPGIFLMQGYTYKREMNTKHCIISIGDSGIGIKNSLMKNPMYKDLMFSDSYVIDYALNKGWSSIGDEKFRGNGFTNLLRLSKKHNLNIYIHSHGGFLGYVYSKEKNLKKMRIMKSIYPIAGTQVCFELKTKL